MITHHFGDVTVEVWEETRFLRTLFPDGTVVNAAPEPTAEYHARALSLGYGDRPDPCWAMCHDHEIAHTRLLQAIGEPSSPTLWAVAHGTESEAPDEFAAEEAMVLAYQAWRIQRRRRAA